MGELFATAVEKIQVAGHAEFADFYFDEEILFDFPAHAHAGHDGDANVHLHEPLDAFDGGQFDGHMQGNVVLGEKLNHALAERRFDDVGYEAFLGEVGELGLAAFGQAMPGRDDEGEFVAKNFRGGELRLLRYKGGDAEVEAVVQQFRGDVAGKRAADGQMDLREHLTV